MERWRPDMFWENVKLALGAMKSNKMRTILSLLGIVIGVASVVAILTLGASVNASIKGSISAGGLELVTIYPTGTSKYASTFNEAFAETLKGEVSAIQEVMPVNSHNALIRNGQNSTNGNISGVQSSSAQVLGYEVEQGSFFSMEDNISKHQVVALGSELAKELFPEGDAVGKYVSIFRNQAKSYLVAAVMESKDASLNLSYNYGAYIPYNTYTSRFMSVSSVGSYIAKIKSDQDPIAASKAITSYLDDLIGSDNYSLFSPATLSEMADQITGTFSTFLAAIAAISLLVGGIGIMNIMLVSVTERTREIGVRKAIGASPSIIMGQFITEAVVLTFVGGVIGITLGTLISYLVTSAMGWGMSISVSSYLLSAGFSMAIGLFFGWYPARKASRLDPIDALNYE